jgi:hypothetical protein
MRIAVLLLAVWIALPAQARGDVFRGFIWGVSPEDVRAYEKAVYYDDRDGLSFFEDIDGARRIYRYDFRDDKLWRIRVSFMELHRPYTQQVLDMIADEQNRLERKYGKPVREGLVWTDNTYRRYGQLFKRAFAMGHVRIEADWQTADTAVQMRAYKGDPYYELQYTIENRAPVNAAEPTFQPFTFNE